MIEHGVLFAARNAGKARCIGEHGPGAILSVESRASRVPVGTGARAPVTRDGREALTQLLPVATVAPVAKRAELLETMGLTNDGAGAHHLSTLAPFVERRHRRHPTIDQARGECFCLGQGSLRGLPHGCHRDQRPPRRFLLDPPDPRFASHWSRSRVGGLSQIIEKKRAHSFNGRLGQCCQKAREGRAGGELVTVKESHEGDRKGLEPLVRSASRVGSPLMA